MGGGSDRIYMSSSLVIATCLPISLGHVIGFIVQLSTLWTLFILRSREQLYRLGPAEYVSFLEKETESNLRNVPFKKKRRTIGSPKIQ
jgi:hypothetical protein